MEIKLLSCPLCLKPHFPGVESLRSSLISVATSHLTCPVCSESLLGLDKLTIHLFTHIADNNGSTKYKEESEVAKSEKELNESINSFNESSVENENEYIKCDICNFTFTDKTILDMHQKLLHQTLPDKNTGLYSYHCHLCSKKFKKRGSLMVHLRVAHYGFAHQNSENDTNNPESPNHNIESAVTMDITTSPQAPQEQIKVQDNKQWECDVCSKMFTTKYFLKKHKRLHTGEMPYYCAQCNKSFTFQQSYHKHMLYHSSEKPYVCNECGRAFKELSTLQNHARIHSGERPFGCETCGKRFRQRVSYLVHQRIHTGVMPYKCTACDKSFRYKVSQRSHKCPITPPGSVVKVSEPEKNQKQETITSRSTANNDSMNVKCIMSVDYNTGNINFIQNNRNDEVKIMYIGSNAVQMNLQDNLVTMNDNGMHQSGDKVDKIVANSGGDLCHNSSPSIYTREQPDLFSMVLSPLLPDVESLCLTNSVTELTRKVEEKHCDSFQIINEESLKELLYGPENK